MKKFLSFLLSALLCAVCLSPLAACGDKGIVIAIPNDTTNEARALNLLEDLGFIKLKDGAGITATVRDIAENPKKITFKEVEAAQIPRSLKSVDYAVINSNYAIGAKIDPKTALAVESTVGNPYTNILAVKSGNETADKTKVLIAALESQKVADFIQSEYKGAIISSVANPGSGYDDTVDYAALAGVKISVAASPTPHAEILEIVKDILADRSITLNIIEYEDYVQPNKVVNSGEIYANYFQHLPYLEDFNAQQNTSVVSVCGVHLEPLGLYGGKQSTLDKLN